jgi:hypothetical protein
VGHAVPAGQPRTGVPDRDRVLHFEVKPDGIHYVSGNGNPETATASTIRGIKCYDFSTQGLCWNTAHKTRTRLRIRPQRPHKRPWVHPAPAGWTTTRNISWGRQGGGAGPRTQQPQPLVHDKFTTRLNRSVIFRT